MMPNSSFKLNFKQAWVPFLFFSALHGSFRFRPTAHAASDPNSNISVAQLLPTSWYNSSGHIAHTMNSEEWIPMTVAESLDFFSLREVCFLNLNMEECNELQGLSDLRCEAQDRGLVHVNNKCSNNKGYFLRHKTHELGKNSFAELIQHMIEKGDNTIMLVGDSIASSMYNDAYCSGVRISLPIRSFTSQREIHPNVGHVAYIYDDHEKAHHEDKNFTVQVMFIGDTVDGNIVRHLDNITSNPIFNIKGNIVMIHNVGLHYYTDENMRDVLKLLIPWTIDMAKKGHVVFFRETSAEHTDTTRKIDGSTVEKKLLTRKNVTTPMSMMGEKLGLIEASKSLRHYDVIDRFSNPDLHLSCKPIQSKAASKKQNWRNQMVHEMYRQLDPQKTVHIIPYYHMTVARYDFHLAVWGDCTHYCFSPTMWAPVWSHVYRSYTGSKKTPSREHTTKMERMR